MSSFTAAPRVAKGAFVVYPDLNSAPKKIIFQYNPDSIQRTLVPQSVPEGGSTEPDPYRVRGEPIETISLDIEFDATDRLEHPDPNATAALMGIHPQLAALELIMHPQTSTTAPYLDTPYTLFVWGPNRVVPVLLTNYLVTEKAFDPNLNPISAKVTILLRVLAADDFTSTHPGRKAYTEHLKKLVDMAALAYQ